MFYLGEKDPESEFLCNRTQQVSVSVSEVYLDRKIFVKNFVVLEI